VTSDRYEKPNQYVALDALRTALEQKPGSATDFA